MGHFLWCKFLPFSYCFAHWCSISNQTSIVLRTLDSESGDPSVSSTYRFEMLLNDLESLTSGLLDDLSPFSLTFWGTEIRKICSTSSQKLWETETLSSSQIHGKSLLSESVSPRVRTSVSILSEDFWSLIVRARKINPKGSLLLELQHVWPGFETRLCEWFMTLAV